MTTNLDVSAKIERIAALEADRLMADSEAFGNGFFARLVAQAAVPVRVRKVSPNGKPLRLFKVRGLWHWRVGRFGGTFYVARRAAMVAALVAVAGAAQAAPVDDVVRCMASGNSFAACAIFVSHNETTENGITVLRGNDPVMPAIEQSGETTIFRGGN